MMANIITIIIITIVVKVCVVFLLDVSVSVVLRTNVSVIHPASSSRVLLYCGQWHTEGGFGVFKPPLRSSEGPPKSCQNQPYCENC